MPLAARLVEQLFGQAPHLKVNPDEVVALGAAIQAHALNRSKSSSKRRATISSRRSSRRPRRPRRRSNSPSSRVPRVSRRTSGPCRAGLAGARVLRVLEAGRRHHVLAAAAADGAARRADDHLATEAASAEETAAAPAEAAAPAARRSAQCCTAHRGDAATCRARASRLLGPGPRGARMRRPSPLSRLRRRCPRSRSAPVGGCRASTRRRRLPSSEPWFPATTPLPRSISLGLRLLRLRRTPRSRAEVRSRPRATRLSSSTSRR